MPAKTNAKNSKAKVAPSTIQMKGGLKVMSLQIDELIESRGKSGPSAVIARISNHLLCLNRKWFEDNGLDKGVAAFRILYSPTYRSIFVKFYPKQIAGTRAWSIDAKPFAFRQSLKGLMSAAKENVKAWQGDVVVEKVFVEGLEEVYLVSKPRIRKV